MRKPVYKTKVVEIKVACCPWCGKELKETTDPDARTLMTYACKNIRANGERCEYIY